MKFLTVRQPDAGVIVAGLKDVENRSRPIAYRGPVVIHAGLEPADFLSRDERFYQAATPLTHITGRLIGVVDVVDCVPMAECLSPWASCFSSWCWVLENPRIFRKSLEWTGKQGLRNIQDKRVDDLVEGALDPNLWFQLSGLG